MPGPGATPEDVELALDCARRAEKGGKLLDKFMHDWPFRVNVLDFDMSNPCKCMLGFVTGKGGWGRVEFREIGIPKDEDKYDSRYDYYAVAEYGFDIMPHSQNTIWEVCRKEYDYLKAAWINEIEKRKGQAHGN